MTTTNISVDEFINVLIEIRKSGVELMDLEMLPDDNHPSMNKLVIHPNKSKGIDDYQENRITIRNPNISSEGNDIFDAFSGLV